MRKIFLCLLTFVFCCASGLPVQSLEEATLQTFSSSEVEENQQQVHSQINLLSLLQGYVNEFLNFFKTSSKSDFITPQWMTASLHLAAMTSEELDQDWGLKDYFGHIKIIGTTESPRFPQLVVELAKVGISLDDVEFSPPVRGADLPKDLWSRVPDWASDVPEKKQGITGCTMAHYYLIKDVQEKYLAALAYWKRVKKDAKASDEEKMAAQEELRKYSSVLIMEDNNAFGRLDSEGVPHLEGLGREFRLVMQQLPENWDIFYFLCLHGPWGPAKEVKSSPMLLQSTYGTSMKCYALNAKSYAKIIKKFEAALTGKGELPPVDHLLASVHNKTYAYMPKLPLAYRYASESLVGGGGDSNSHWQTNPY